MFRTVFLAAALLCVNISVNSSHASEPVSGPQLTGPQPCAIAQPSPPKEIKHDTGAIDVIKKPAEITPLGCERPFVYKGAIYSADSPQAADASNLKSFIQSVPESKEIMDQYQSNRNKSKISAYTGTVGIALFLLSNIVSQQFEPGSRESIRSAMSIGGITLAGGGFIYSFALLRTNEFLIPKAVDTYNQAKPDDKVELQFSTSWGF